MIIYGRRMEVRIAGLTIREPKIAIDIDRQPDEKAPSGHVTISNLAPEREAQIEERGRQLTVIAGYTADADRSAIVYQGATERVTRERRALERLTRIELGSQTERMIRGGVISVRTYAGETAARTIAFDLVGDLGLFPGPLDAIPENVTVTDWTWASRTDVALSAICRRAGVTWYEDDGTIRFNRAGSAQVGVEPIMLSPDTGLIGAPARTDYGAEATSFLEPRARIGAALSLRSEALSGEFKVIGLRHTGDNWTGSFRTEYRLRELDAPPPTPPISL